MEKARTTKKTTMRLLPQDKAVITQLREIYGCSSDTEAVRIALRRAIKYEGQAVPSPKET